MKKLIVALIAGAAAMSAAQAQTVDTQPHVYAGVGLSSAKNTQLDEYKATGKVYGGYVFNRTWAAEVGYTDFGTESYANGNTQGNSYYVAAKATMPINNQFGVYAKLGAEHSERKLNTALVNRSSNDTGAYGALGVQYNLNQQLALTAEYERFGKEKDFGARANVWTVGAHYNF